MNKDQRLRNVLLVGCHFARNWAYCRAGEDYSALHDKNEFWRSVTMNSFDIAVIEWCKIFGSSNTNKHYWCKVVSDSETFQRGLISKLTRPDSLDAFLEYSKAIRTYRDKLVAHLESEPILPLPDLDDAWESVQYYYDYVLNEESPPNAFLGFPTEIGEFYNQKHTEAKDEHLRRMT